jgi:lauroyl/myristoyl acyltransferase
MKLFSAVLDRPRLQRRLLRGHIRELRDTLQLSEVPCDERTACRRHLLLHYIMAYRVSALARLAQTEFNRHVRVPGMDRLAQATADGRGALLLAAHVGPYLLAPYVTARAGYRVHSLEGRTDLRDGLDPEVEGLDLTVDVVRGSAPLQAQRVFLARESLLAGKIVHIAPDGCFGSSGPVLPFLGRERRFAAAFASLALACSVEAYPLRAELLDDGTHVFEVLPALEKGNAAMSEQDRIAHMVRQFANILEGFWRRTPWAVARSHLRRHARARPA